MVLQRSLLLDNQGAKSAPRSLQFHENNTRPRPGKSAPARRVPNNTHLTQLEPDPLPLPARDQPPSTLDSKKGRLPFSHPTTPCKGLGILSRAKLHRTACNGSIFDPLGPSPTAMVLYFTSTAVDPPATIYMGKDKHENEELLRYGLECDVWFHVDKLSSAHVYLRLPAQIESWEAIPEPLLNDCSQLVKANSIEGSKKSNLTIIYTPWSNVKKTGDMAVGAVTFFNDRKVRRFHVKEKDNAVVNRLNKTKREVQVDHEAERQERLRQEGRAKKAKAIEDVSPASLTALVQSMDSEQLCSVLTQSLRPPPLLCNSCKQKKAQQAEQKRRKEEADARDYSKRKSTFTQQIDTCCLAG